MDSDLRGARPDRRSQATAGHVHLPLRNHTVCQARRHGDPHLGRQARPGRYHSMPTCTRLQILVPHHAVSPTVGRSIVEAAAHYPPPPPAPLRRSGASSPARTVGTKPKPSAPTHRFDWMTQPAPSGCRDGHRIAWISQPSAAARCRRALPGMEGATRLPAAGPITARAPRHLGARLPLDPPRAWW